MFLVLYFKTCKCYKCIYWILNGLNFSFFIYDAQTCGTWHYTFCQITWYLCFIMITLYQPYNKLHFLRKGNSHAWHWKWKNLGKNKNEWEAQSHNGWYQGWKTSLSQSLKNELYSTTCHRIPPISRSTVITFVCLWILDPRNLKWHENKSCWLKHCFHTEQMYWGVYLRHTDCNNQKRYFYTEQSS